MDSLRNMWKLPCYHISFCQWVIMLIQYVVCACSFLICMYCTCRHFKPWLGIPCIISSYNQKCQISHSPLHSLWFSALHITDHSQATALVYFFHIFITQTSSLSSYPFPFSALVVTSCAVLGDNFLRYYWAGENHIFPLDIE